MPPNNFTPSDTLGEEVQEALKGAADYIRPNRPDERRRQPHLANLRNMASRLEADIQGRQTTYRDTLDNAERAAVDGKWAELNQSPGFLHLSNEQRTQQQSFDQLRLVNNGIIPRNISPVVYVIPLFAVGIAEWYVNYSTFAAIFVPAIAAAATIIVALIFASASDLHGKYIKQLAEILHPSVEYRNELGRKIILVIVTILLIGALVTVIWLRYSVIADQLGISSDSSSSTFGGASTSMIWSRLGPTIVLNILIWGLGTFYAWAASEKIPHLREAYRDLLRANKKLAAARAPVTMEERRIKAHFARERDKNDVAIREYSNALENVRGMAQRLQEN